ncbi:MAG: hypothetical protein H6718_02195 [Polyangiaceae bacterium]|nr:hypothetical protein [Myxococcales bacterium]MCB9584174.1 hypothetical protein [Polyangiaceae bacterium]MCB9608664.1 hypothetical protein [Polyangiaceae bacterium]
MVSATQQTERRRSIRARKAGTKTAKARAKSGTPAFAVHPEGYDPKAPDAKPAKSE